MGKWKPVRLCSRCGRVALLVALRERLLKREVRCLTCKSPLRDGEARRLSGAWGLWGKYETRRNHTL